MRLRLSASLLLFVSAAFSQSQMGELRLAIADSTGAAVQASAALASESTGTRQSVLVHSDGTYSFRNLPFGVYRLEIAKEGFAASAERVEIRSAVPLNREIHLSVAAIATTVTIAEHETLLDPRRTNAASYIGEQSIKERPTGVPGRGILGAVATQPGWTFEANGILHPRESEYDTQFVIDGFPVYDNRSPAFAPAVEADNVESVKAYAGGIPAEFGQKLGGVIELNTQRNTSSGFHGSAALQGGTYSTVNGFLNTQFVVHRTTYSLGGQGFTTDRYLDPPVLANFTNHGSNGAINAAAERDLDDNNRVRVSFDHRSTWFMVPNDLLQQTAGQREDRTSGNNEGRVSFQHIFSPSLLGVVRGQVRDVEARLWSNPLTTPISVQQDRGYREGYVNGSLAGHHGIHEWKTGVEARWASIDEQFGFHIVQYRVNPGNVRVFDRDIPATFSFSGHSPDREQAVYAQDAVVYRNFTFSAGLRFDHYRLLTDDTGWSPRLAAAWHSTKLGLVLHASYDRTFGTPPFENILVSSSPAAQFNGGFYLPLQPSRGNYYEAGLAQSLGQHVRLDASYFRRNVTNFLDDNPLVNTGVSFPISFRHAVVRGFEAKLEVPRWGRFSGYLNYANTIGLGQFPISGGLFLDDGDAASLKSTETFPISQDQRNTAHGALRYQIFPRLWTSWSAAYTSGLPTDDNLPNRNFLVAQYGEDVVSRINMSRGRVNPSFELNASVGAELWRLEKRSVSLQFDAENITDRVNVINFAGLLSGTAVGPQRHFGIRLRADF